MKFSNYIVKGRFIILALYILILPIAFISWQHTPVNTSLTSYLPPDLDSVKGLEILEDNFQASSSAFIFIEDQSRGSLVSKIVSKVEKVKNVKNVLSTQSFGILTLPPEFVPETYRSQFYSGNGILITIQFSFGSEDERTFKAVRDIQEIIKPYERVYLGGFAVINEESNRDTRTQKLDVSLFITIGAVFIFLMFATKSFILAFLFLLSIVVSYVINMGTNFFFKDISYLTSGLTGALQLGVSIDYSIFLYHRFEEELKNHPDENIMEAMAISISRTTSSIFTSSVTTLIGFLTITIMSIRIGFDLGIVLAKGVFLSFFATITFLPAFILILYKIIDKTRFKFKFQPKFVDRVIDTYKKPKTRSVILIVFIVLAIFSCIGYYKVPISYQITDSYSQSMKSIKATNFISEKTNSADIISLLIPMPTYNDPEKQEYYRMIEEINKVDGVSLVLNVNFGRPIFEPVSFIPQETLDTFYKNGYLVAHIKLKYQGGTEESYRTITAILGIIKQYYSDYYLSGQGVMIYDFTKLANSDFIKINLLSIIFVFLVLVIYSFSFLIPLMLVFLIEIAISFNFGINFIQQSPVSFIAQIIMGSIQLGATVDYAVLFINRFMEEMDKGHTRINCVINSIKATYSSILSAALCLFIATFTYGLFSDFPVVKMITFMIGRGALISFVFVVVFLPLFSYLIFKRIKFSVDLKKKVFRIKP